MRRVVVGRGSAEESAIVLDADATAELVSLAFNDGELGGMTSSSLSSLPDPASLETGSFAIGQLWLMDNAAEVFKPRSGDLEDVGSFSEWAANRQPGSVSWIAVVFGPNTKTEMHATATVDMNLITEGEVDLVTESGTTTLKKGDCGVVPGLLHAWHAGPEGTTMICAATATDPEG
jgi:quercetin dioxygenase-like cupin family protein